MIELDVTTLSEAEIISRSPKTEQPVVAALCLLELYGGPLKLFGGPMQLLLGRLQLLLVILMVGLRRQ